MNGQGKIAKQIGGKGFYALVDVTCTAIENQSASITIQSFANDDWHRSEGWTDAAIAGAEIGLKLASASYDCTITRIHGMPCDTNSTLVAIAGIRAVWAAIGFDPDPPTADQLEGLILRRSSIGVADLKRELGV